MSAAAWPLLAAAAVTGLGASVHCAVMCTLPQQMALRGIPIVVAAPAADAASGASAASPTALDTHWLALQAGRITGYAGLGMVLGLAGEAMLAAARWQGLFESVWAALNAALLLLGLALLLGGREPAWALRLSQWGPRPPAHGPRTVFLRGLLWALMPCGALYGAAGLALLAARPLPAAAVMALFGLGTTVGLGVIHHLLRGLGARASRAGYRMQGLLLASAAAAGLAAALGGTAHPFCG